MLAVVVDHRRAVSGGIKHAVDDPADAPAPRDDDRVVLVDGIGLAAALPGRIGMRDELVVEDEQQRGDQHGQRDDQQQLIGEGGFEHRIGDAEGDQDEGELARLRQAQAEQPQRLPPQAVEPADQQQHCHLGSHRHRGPEHHRIPDRAGEREVDPRADSDEEQPQQQALERVDVAFELVAVFAGGKHHARDEGAERGREADQRHQQRDPDHHEQCCGGEQFAQVGARDVAEQRADREDADRDHCGDRTDPCACSQPARHVCSKVDPAMRAPARVVRSRTGEFGQRKQRHQREDRDDRDVLHQQHREARFAALGLEQALLGQRLDDDRGRAERQHHADRQRGLPALVGQQRDAGQRERGQQHLSAAQPGELAAHRPQAPRLHFQPDDEQHHHHAEFGEDLQRLDIDRQRGEER